MLSSIIGESYVAQLGRLPDARDLGTLLTERAHTSPDSVAVFGLRGPITYAELEQQATRVAKSIRAHGIDPGERVGILSENRDEWLGVMFGAAKAGTPLASLSTWFTMAELSGVLERTRVRLLFYSPRIVDRDLDAELSELANEASTLPVLTGLVRIGDGSPPAGTSNRLAGVSSWEQFLQIGASRPHIDKPQHAHRPSPDDTALILYTSGSTGPPKGVPLGHEGLVRNSYWNSQALGMTSHDRVLLAVPLCFAFGCIQIVMSAFTLGGAVVLQQYFEPEEALDLIQQHGVTVWFGVPRMAQRIRALPSFTKERVKTLRTGRAGHARGDLEFARNELSVEEICNGYGMTEMFGPVAVARFDDPLDWRLDGWCQVLPNIEIRILDPETGEIVPRGVEGEIRVRSTYGYRNYDAGEPFLDDNGFAITGDRGTIREDGRFRFTGRIKNMIKSNALNVAPEKIETVFLSHPAVAEASVFGVPDPQRGEAPVVVVSLSAEVDADELADWATENLRSHERPARIVIWPTELPKMGAHGETKIDRLGVRRQVEELAGSAE
jgi:fatty-acyl-CoA synthase